MIVFEVVKVIEWLWFVLIISLGLLLFVFVVEVVFMFYGGKIC